jgi:hypothetical protein
MAAQDELSGLLRARAVVRDRPELEDRDRPLAAAFETSARQQPLALSS